MVYELKQGTLIDALCAPILGNERKAQKIVIDGNKATVQFYSRNNHGLPINLQCTGATSPVRFKGLSLDEQNNYQMHFEMTQPNQQPFAFPTDRESPRDYVLQFTTSTPLPGALHHISKAILRQQQEPEDKKPLPKLPDAFDSFIRYQTQTGEWNALPQELLPFTTKFNLKVRNIGIEYESFRKGVIKLTPLFQQSGNNELYEEVVRRLQAAGLIERSRTERGNQKYDTITLTNPRPAEVMRPLEDVLRCFDAMPLGQYEEGGGKAEIEIHGKIPTSLLARIPKTLPMQAGSFRSELLTVDTYNEGGFNAPRITTISFPGTLETAARMESLMTYLKDLKLQAYDSKQSPQRSIPIFRLKEH